MPKPLPSKSFTHSISDYNFTILLKGLPKTIDAMGDDSEAFTYERNKAETMEVVSDCSGDGHWSIDPDKTGKIVLKMLHTNPYNAFMQSLRGPSGPGVELMNTALFDVLINDNKGNPFLRANKCRIQGQPQGSRGKKINTIEWTIVCVELLVNETGMVLDV